MKKETFVGTLKDSMCVIALPAGNTQAKTPTGFLSIFIIKLTLSPKKIKKMRRDRLHRVLQIYPISSNVEWMHNFLWKRLDTGELPNR